MREKIGYTGKKAVFPVVGLVKDMCSFYHNYVLNVAVRCVVFCALYYYVMLCNRMLYCACAQVKNCSGYHVASWAEKRGKSCLILYEDTT